MAKLSQIIIGFPVDGQAYKEIISFKN